VVGGGAAVWGGVSVHGLTAKDCVLHLQDWGPKGQCSSPAKDAEEGVERCFKRELPATHLASFARFTAGSCLGWTAVAVGAHVASIRLLPQYRSLKHKDRLAWCNRVVSGLHVSRRSGHAFSVP